MSFPQNNTRGGYIALISVIIISLILMTLALSNASLGVSVDNLLLETENKEQAYYAAKGCLNQALFTLSVNPLYTGNETLQIRPGVLCTIYDVKNHTVTIGSTVNSASIKFIKNI